jgi:hypothetical protein
MGRARGVSLVRRQRRQGHHRVPVEVDIARQYAWGSATWGSADSEERMVLPPSCPLVLA